MNFIQRLDVDELKNIKKIKYLRNYDIAIIYGDYNIAIYDFNYNIIKFRIKNDFHNNQIFMSNYFLKYLDEYTILYNPTKYSLQAINYIKGQTLAKFSDGHNRIIRCKKIHLINVTTDNYEEKIKYYFIINIKGYFILTCRK